MGRNLLQEEMSDAVIEIVDDAGYDIEWKGREYRAILDDPQIMQELEIGGFAPSGSWLLKIPRKCFNMGDGPFPEINDRIKMEGKAYKVIENTNRPCSPLFAITVEA